MGRLKIESLSDALIPSWEAFVAQADDATFFHRAAWKTVIERSFGHECHFLLARRGERISGVLPLVHIDSRFFGKALISTAFGVVGGPLASDDESLNALDAAARSLAERLGVDYLEYRLGAASTRNWPADTETYAQFRKPLPADPDDVLPSIPRKRRAEVRKAMAAGLASRVERDVERFYPVYAASVRGLGTPVYARAYFRNLIDAFGDDCDVLTVLHRERPVSSVLSFYFRDTVLPYYGGGIDEARGLAANDFMYWQLMRRASQRGLRIFDFGRSKVGTGAFAYKRHWGFEARGLHYEYLLLRRRELPRLNPSNPKFRLLIAIWKHLPLAVCNLLGPRIARDLG